ncbi:hypothetical protein LEMLEM_LOCUS6056 [Lemmus lemmus]
MQPSPDSATRSSEYVQGVQPVDEFSTPAEPRVITIHPEFVQELSPSHLSAASPLCRGFWGVRARIFVQHTRLQACARLDLSSSPPATPCKVSSVKPPGPQRAGSKRVPSLGTDRCGANEREAGRGVGLEGGERGRGGQSRAPPSAHTRPPAGRPRGPQEEGAGKRGRAGACRLARGSGAETLHRLGKGRPPFSAASPPPFF